MYLKQIRAPDLDEYLAWKAVSHASLMHKFSVRGALSAYVLLYHELLQYRSQQAVSDSTVAVAPTNLPPTDSPEMDAARILTTISFRAHTSGGTLHPYPLIPNLLPHEPMSVAFPRPDDLVMPSGADAFLLNPILEDAQRRWVRGVHKEDKAVDVTKKDANGNRYTTRKTIYIVDGQEFYDTLPQHKRGSGGGRKRKPPKIDKTNTGLIGGSAVSVPVNEPRSRKRLIDSAIALDDDFESPLRKRTRSDSSNDIPLSSISRPGAHLPRRSSGSRSSRKVSGCSNSSGSQLSINDVDNLRAVLGPVAMSTVMGAFKSTGQSIMPMPATKSNAARELKQSIPPPSTGAAANKPRRRARPAPLNLAVPTRSTRARATPSPSPMTPAATPQHRSAPGTTPRKNKYVPTTPNPQRWTAVELYYLNGLARQGLHPKELHPKMVEKFPDRIRSIHAIKDRRDKMARNKELQGKVPDYLTKYGNA